MKKLLIAALTACCLLPAAYCSAQGGQPQNPAARPPGPTEEMLKTVRLDQKLNGQVPLDVAFRDETGKSVRLGDYLGTKPVMLVMIQYRCTMLCTEQMNILMDSLKRLKFTPGDEFNLLVVSIDPKEDPQLAAEVKASYLKEYRRPEAAAGWHFLTGEKASIDRLADAVGYHYVYDQRTEQYAHPDGVIILTPAGKIARYFFSLLYPAPALRFGLIEAADGKIGTLMDGIALLCYHYNPVTGTYTVAFMKVLRIAAIGTLLALCAAVLILRLRERDRRGRGGQVGGEAALGSQG